MLPARRDGVRSRADAPSGCADGAAAAGGHARHGRGAESRGHGHGGGHRGGSEVTRAEVVRRGSGQSAIFTVEDLPGAPQRRILIGGRDRQNRPGSSFAPSVESIDGPRGLIAEVPEDSIKLTDVGSISERVSGLREARGFGSAQRFGPRVGGFHCERRARRRAVGDDARPLGPRPAQQETQHRPPRLQVHSRQAQGRRRGWSGAPPHHKGAHPRPPPPPQSRASPESPSLPPSAADPVSPSRRPV